MFSRFVVPPLDDHPLDSKVVRRFHVHGSGDANARQHVHGLGPISGSVSVPQRDPEKEPRLGILLAHHRLSKELHSFGVVASFLLHPSGCDQDRHVIRGKTFLAHALGHLACRRGHSVVAVRADKMLKGLRHARLDNSYDAELRRLIAVDLLLVDDFGLDAMDSIESRDAYEILTERHRAGSIIVTSNRGPDEWLATFADPVRAQAAIDRFTSNAYDMVVDGESYRRRLKPTLARTDEANKAGQKKKN